MDFVKDLTERQKGHLPDLMGLEWVEAEPGRVRGRFLRVVLVGSHEERPGRNPGHVLERWRRSPYA